MRYRRCVIVIAAAIWAACVGKAAAEQTNESLSILLNGMRMEDYQDVIANYQEKYPEVELQVESYGMEEYQSIRKQMETQLMAGKGPDLLLLGAYDFDDVYKLMKAGALASLTPYMEADTTYRREDYIQSVMDEGKFGGEQYIIPLNYAPSFVLSSKQCLEENGFDMENCSTFPDFFSQTAALYETGYKDRIMASVGGMGGFVDLMGIPLFDYDTGDVLLDTPEMETAMHQYKKMYLDDTAVENNSLGAWEIGEAIKNREAYLYGGGSPMMLLTAAGCIADTEEPVLLPFPTMNGQRAAVINDAVAVRSNSSNQENAWNFIHMLLEDQVNHIDAWGYPPVNKKAVRLTIEAAAEEAEYEMLMKAETVQELPQGIVDMYLEQILEPENCSFFNKLTQDLIYEYMVPFFENKDTYESCMEKFVSYAKIYVSE